MNIVQNLSEITDSREMLEAKPHKFTSIFAYGLIGILAIALIWSYFGEIDIVTKSNGVVTSNDKTISVLNEVDGKVIDVNFKEGQAVKEGDVLYTLDCSDAALNKDNYEKQLNIFQTDTDNIDKLRNSILENTNYFDANNPDEADYYNKYVQYSTTNQKLSLTEKQTDLQTDATNDNKLILSKSYTQQISENNDILNGLDTLLQSINDSKNNFSNADDKYSSEYSDYEYSIQSLQNTIEQRKTELQNANTKYKEAMNDYESQMDNATIDYNNSILKLQQYKSSYLANVQDSITQAENSSSNVNYDYPTVSTQIGQTQTTIDNLQLLVQSINQGQNLFTDSNSTYYKQYVDYTNNLQKYTGADQDKYKNSYLLSINQSIDSAKNTLAQLQSTSSVVSTKNDTINDSIDKLKKLKSAIEDDSNDYSDSDNEYNNKFKEYEDNVKELQNTIKTQKDLIANLKKKKDTIIDDYNDQISATQKVLDNAKVDLDKYKNKSAFDIKDKLDEVKKDTEKVQAELDQARITPELDAVNKEMATNDITKYKMDTLVKLDDSEKENEQKIDELKTNIGTLQFRIDKSTVKANIDGIVNVKTDVSKGQLLKSGEEILSVIPQDSSEYKVKLYVSNKDIAGIKAGQNIKYHFEALPYKEYGELKGTITDIATDATVDQRTGVSYYLVESEIENKPLFSYKGEEGEVKMGMTCEAQVITKQKKILYYLLEKIHLKD
ncbi:HlyD family efflux transporter periplasmic adaptor subunit [Clostridium sp.]|uniref:HlyD family efflux transporter periplasmic adaptor subunit n=1 Tax=Clostridium sp. TaxID=1506 RepID=UPI0028436DC5|nr:HlyD family efflux transporter periplasmic adaptor subunit [Clostridium sp.]MDR3598491.1 HlyD family efflux transporter periplasmic adaptor subunit [Clostridium sp.]